MKFRSLLFREFRLSKKSILLQFGLLLGEIAMTVGMLFSLGANENTKGELPPLLGIVDAMILMTALVSSMSLMLDENFKADVNTGWLNYSYALPITPFERTAARFVRRLSVSLVSVFISLCNAAALCVYTERPFGVNYIVWHMIVFAAVTLNSLPANIFTLRIRNGADLKKAQTKAGLTSLALMAALVVIVWNASGIDISKFTESDAGIELPVFDARALAWAIPLLLVMIAASFFTAYLSIRSAYPRVSRTKKEEEIPPIVLPVKTDGATGLLYKELKQNRLVFILAACAPLLLTLFPFCFQVIGVITGGTNIDEMFELTTSVFIRMIMFVGGIFAVSALMSEVFKGDDKKLWAYFIVSTPQGVKGFIYRKYVITLMINLIYMISGIFTDHLFATVNYFITGKELATNMQSLYISGVFLLMSVSALDIPFMVRFGSKKGSVVKMIIMLSLCTAGVVVFSMLPDNIKENITQTLISIFNGGAGNALMLILSLLPFIAFAAFLLSYKIACRLFMKGVNDYDK